VTPVAHAWQHTLAGARYILQGGRVGSTVWKAWSDALPARVPVLSIVRSCCMLKWTFDAHDVAAIALFDTLTVFDHITVPCRHALSEHRLDLG